MRFLLLLSLLVSSLLLAQTTEMHKTEGNSNAYVVESFDEDEFADEFEDEFEDEIEETSTEVEVRESSTLYGKYGYPVPSIDYLDLWDNIELYEFNVSSCNADNPPPADSFAPWPYYTKYTPQAITQSSDRRK